MSGHLKRHFSAIMNIGELNELIFLQPLSHCSAALLPRSSVIHQEATQSMQYRKVSVRVGDSTVHVYPATFQRS
jgi:hypothetical protein